MATQSKAQLVGDVLTLLKKRSKQAGPSAPEKPTVLEASIYAICHEGTTQAKAGRALDLFKSGFFDWNEVRVSSIAEIQAVLEKEGISGAEDRANRIRRFLRQLFEKSYHFNLDGTTKKPLKDSLKALHEYEAFGSDFVSATVTRLALGGHAIGIDAPMRRALERLGIADQGVDDATLRGALERAVPKTRGAEFVDLIEELAHDTCIEGTPDCPRCELRKICPSSLTHKAEVGVLRPTVRGAAPFVAEKPAAAPPKPAKAAPATPVPSAAAVNPAPKAKPAKKPGRSKP